MNDVVVRSLDIWSSVLVEKNGGGRGRNGRQEAFGIRKLRDLILELAMRGMLVPQDQSEESAYALMGRIARAKSRLEKEGRIRRQKTLPKISRDEFAYKLPSGWCLVRLGDVAFPQAGFAFRSRCFNERGDGLPLIRIRDVGQEFSGTYYSGEYRDEFIVERGDYLISMDGEFRVSPWQNGKALLNQRVARLIFFDNDVSKRLIAESLQVRLKELQGVKAYTTVDHLSGKQIAESLIALPPLAEQHRIVAKVDELMALCDRLEKQQFDSAEAHQTLVETLLDTLTRAESQQELNEAWSRVAEHFDTLFTTEESVEQLKRTILQLGVMGKLVSPLRTGETATVLRKKIHEEKMRLVEKGIIRTPKALADIDSAKIPFKLPNTWAWVRLGEVTSKITDGDHKTPPRISKGQRLLSAKNVRDGFLDTQNCDFISEEHYLKSRERCCPEAGDLLIVSVGGTIGRTSLVPDDAEFALVRSVALVKPLLVNPRYLEIAMNSALMQESIHSRKRGGAQPCLYLSEIENFLFPLPPVVDQALIAEKVDAMLSVCDRLSFALMSTQKTVCALADSVVAHTTDVEKLQPSLRGQLGIVPKTMELA